MNLLMSRFDASKFVILGFPCNQFGHQENSTDAEILNMLRHVRPGNNFEPKIELFSKIEVNGEKAHPLFQFLRTRLPHPQDNSMALMTDPKLIIWSPVTRSDLSWNFEKFLIDPNGQPFRRYSPKFETINVEYDIKALMSGCGKKC